MSLSNHGATLQDLEGDITTAEVDQDESQYNMNENEANSDGVGLTSSLQTSVNAIGSESNKQLRARRFALLVILLAAFGVNLTLTVLTVALPDISDDFDSSADSTAWITIAPTIVAALCVPAFGRASDTYGHRTIWLLGLVITSLSLIACGLSPNLPLLVFSRVFSGIGTGAVFPSSLSLITSMYPEGQRAGPIGMWTSATALSPMIGVVLGGMILEVLSWRWLFYLQLPFAVLSFIGGIMLIDHAKIPEVSRKLDIYGLITLTGCTGSLLLGVNQGAQIGWASPLLIVCYVVFPGL
eukprot:TRINITY_DN9929_c0_g1_i2.p1 TRINITY_DN9929_c0_g1~~TRINITY_DN9929_c0_g1_i2.p1  ORF type:complete len:297 (-),score=46.60 TRINITY_DN9929_c0_g1_i2:1137-2027(-)